MAEVVAGIAAAHDSSRGPGSRARPAAARRHAPGDLAFDAGPGDPLPLGPDGVTRALHSCRGTTAGGRRHSARGYGAIRAEPLSRLAFRRLLAKLQPAVAPARRCWSR